MKKLIILWLAILSLLFLPSPTITQAQKGSTATPSRTPTMIAATNTATLPTATATSLGAPIAPYPSAPLCPSHDNSEFHTLWNSVEGCHYDHEHGTDPFTAAAQAVFPNFDLRALQCGNEIGHCNPSSPMEITHKHGGFKYDVVLNAPRGCEVGFEGGTVAIDAAVIQYHAFGRQDVEFEANQHSAVFLYRQCKASDPADKGYIFVGTLQHYGERVSPYQGQVLQFPNDFLPRWNGVFGQYLTTDNTANRDPNNQTLNNNSKWTSKTTGCTFPCTGVRPSPNRVARLLFDVRDAYQLWDASDTVYPFSWVWMCGNTAYNPAGCRFNNSTGTVHEVQGDIPASWDNVAGLDSDPRVGRITGEFFVDATGVLNPACTMAGGNCYPIKLMSAFVGRYSSTFCGSKCSNNTPATTPERDVYFCNGVQCAEGAAGAVPSGWIGSEN